MTFPTPLRLPQTLHEAPRNSVASRSSVWLTQPHPPTRCLTPNPAWTNTCNSCSGCKSGQNDEHLCPQSFRQPSELEPGTMFVSCDDAAAKGQAAGLLCDLGWNGYSIVGLG